MDPFAPIEFDMDKSALDKKLQLWNSSQENSNSVGSIRYTFLQLRNCPNLTPDYILWNGSTAGEFALSYLLMSNSLKKKSAAPCERPRA